MTKESDTLLRAYSRVDIDSVAQRNRVPHLEGVKVRSTPAKSRSGGGACAKSGGYGKGRNEMLH